MRTSTAAFVDPPPGGRAIAWWLLTCCGLVATIVVVGGATRLTGSGLSIVVWEPIIGIIPPLSDRAWREAFELYRQFPEYRQRNLGMSLDEFRFIFWWEYWHRVLGRLIGLVYFTGFAWFLFTRQIDRPLTIRLGAIFVLGSLQGFLGWYMVTSGLVDEPRVSQYRLAAHLGLAFVIHALMFWQALNLLRPPPGPATAPGVMRGLRPAIWLVTALIAVTIVSGGFVAGTRAGFLFNTFPLMGGQWVPHGILALDPALINLFENPVTIQFTHRVLAMIVVASIVGWWLVAIRRPLSAGPRLAAHLLLGAGVLQAALGIATLVLQVPTVLAVAHQAGALLLLTAALYAAHTVGARNASPQ